MINSSVERPNK